MHVFPQQENFVGQMTKVLDVFVNSEAQIRPHCHVTGPSGSGKSYLMKELCEIGNIPMMEINAAQLTAEGLSGNSMSKALRGLKNNWATPNVIFVDEFDKLFQRNGDSTENFRSMVQDEFLTALESKYTSVFGDYGKYDQVVIDNSLFVFAGAYSNQEIRTIADLRDAGLRTEFVGRVPLVLYTEEIPITELKKHVSNVELYKQYANMFPHRVKGAVNAIIGKLEEQDREFSIGIRLLNSVIHQYFMADPEPKKQEPKKVEFQSLFNGNAKCKR